MKVELSNLGRVKVTLNRNDLQRLGLKIDALHQPTISNKIILLALFKAASIRLNQSTDASKILIEAYPHINNGGVFYFTPLKADKKKFLGIKACPLYAFDFYDGTNLLCAIEQLYINESNRKIFCRIYDINGTFRLVLAASPHEVCEFCDCYFPFSEVKKYTCEHGRVLTGDNAINEIGLKLKCL